MLFDYYNPWAKLVQLNSTHPLTGRRIAHLGRLAKEKGQCIGPYDVEAAAMRVQLSRGRLRLRFVAELLLLLFPLLLGLAVGLLGAWPLVPAAIARRAPHAAAPLSFWRAVQCSVMGLMSDPAASPVRARSVRLEGKAIGRVDPGFIAGEDFIFQDRTGLIAVDFRSMLGIIGNLFAGWKRVPKHVEQPSEVRGWFRRGMSGYVILRELNSTSGRLRARPLFWQILICLAVIAANIWIVAAQ